MKTNEPEFREVERIKCLRCNVTSKDFDVSTTFMCGEEGFDILESPICPYCKSGRVLEILGVEE